LTRGSPAVVYGAPGRRGAVCTDEVLKAGTWMCTRYDVLVYGKSGAQAGPAAVPSASVRVVDQSTGRWVCVGGSSAIS
jgi:hypothetical protein